LFSLFFAIDELDADNDFGDQFRTVEPALVFLGFQPPSLKTMVSVASREPEPLVQWVRSKGGFYGIGGP
jgi:hypothetical protein